MNYKSIRKASSILAESQSILSVFSKTIEKLKQLNTESKEAYELNESKINELNEENKSLTAIINSNDTVISKISNMLGSDNE